MCRKTSALGAGLPTPPPSESRAIMEQPLYWQTGIGDSKLHNAVALDQDRIGVLKETMNGGLAHALAEGTLTPEQSKKVRWIPYREIAAVAKSADASVLRIEYSGGKRQGLAATPDDIPKLQRVFAELKAKIAPAAALEQTQATVREAIEAPSVIFGLIALVAGAIWLAFGGQDEAAPGRRGFGNLLSAIGLGNLMWSLAGLAALVLLWGIIRLVHRPPMTMFRRGERAA